MPENREVERQIVIRGRQRGMSDDQLKEAVLKFRSQGEAPPVPEVAQSAPSTGVQVIPQQPATDFLGPAIKDTAKGFGVGLVKGASSTMAGASALGEKMLGKFTGALGLGSNKNPLGDQILSSGVLTPKNDAEKVGFGTERIGETLAVDALTGGAGGLGVLPKAGVRAVQSGGLTAIHEGKLDGNAKRDAMLAGGMSLAGDAFSYSIKKIPNTAWDTILRRTPTEKAAYPNLGRDLAKDGFSAATLDSAASKAKTEIEIIGTKVTDHLKNSTGTIKGEALANTLEDLKQSYAMVPGEEGSVKAIEQLQKEAVALGDMSGTQADKVKKEIYKITSGAYGKSTMDLPAKVAGQKQLGHALKLEIEKIAPVEKLNERQGLMIELRNAIESSVSKTQGKGIFGSGVGMFDLASVGFGSAAAGPWGGAAALAGKKFIESPAFQTNLARLAEWYNEAPPEAKSAIYSFLLQSTKNGMSGLGAPNKK